MKKFIIQTVLLILVIAIAFFVYRANPSVSNLPFVPAATVFREVQINNAKLKVEVADTAEKRSQGLGGRQSLGQDEGMLFVFPSPGTHAFWMKGLTFPLDFIWIRGGKVIDLTPNVPPPASGQPDSTLPIYQPKQDVDKVLEVNGGTIQRLNIKVGDMIKTQ
ncbi:MAG: DUF192 domain-containing protein [Patescibacteria group bacterium]|nr:DUF192 domain-containing protein [Patescibacteria group bacterium]